jgi:phage gp45-like
MINKILNMIKRCVVTLPSDDKDQFPRAQISYFGKPGNSEEIYPYGIGGVAPKGSTGIVFSIRGDEGNRAHIATATDLRIKNLKEGETYAGNLVSGSVYIFKENGDWDVTITKDGNLTFNGDLNITVNGNVTVNSGGNVDVSASGDANVNATNVNLGSKVNLGSGGQPIARTGDTVLSLSPPFPPIGTIGPGSANHTAS